MFHKKTLSIIVPIYNAEPYLTLCVNSILNQTFQDFEIILVDDGSKDLSGKICDELELKDSRIRVIHKDNSGVSATRNIGIKEASGEWITFVDADDELLQEALSIFMWHTKEDYDLIEYAHCMLKNGKIITPNRKKEEIIIDKNKFYSQFFSYPWYAYHGYVYAKLYKKDIIDKYNIRFTEDIYYKEDGLFVCQYVAHCKNILQSTETVYKYYIRENSAVDTYNRLFNIKSFSHLSASSQIYEIIKKQNLGKEIEKEAKRRICYSYDLLKGSYKSSEIKDEELYLKMNELFKKNISAEFYFKYEFNKGFHFFKRQFYLLLKFLKIKK